MTRIPNFADIPFAAASVASSTGQATSWLTPEGIADGNAVLGRLFGSKDVSRAIAAQAAQMTGIGQEIYKRMLPAMADTLMGGLFKETSGQIPQMADGGIVHAQPGGGLFRLGEGRFDEMVTPLDPRGMSHDQTTFILEMDGQRVARATIPHFPGELRRLRLA